MNNTLKIAYIRQNDRRYIRLLDKIIYLLSKAFIIVQIEKIESSIIVLIPKYSRYSGFAKRIIVKQLYFKIKNFDEYYLVFDSNLNFFNSDFNKSKILSGKMFMKFMIFEILSSIFTCNFHNMNMENIYLFVNEYNEFNLYIIKKLIPNFKTVNIITENLKYYKRLENKFYEQGILITVSNNKRKSLKNAKYIINLDFTQEQIKEYIIKNKSIIINCIKEKLILKNGFCGIIINDFEVILSKNFEDYLNEFYGNFNKNIYFESKMLIEDWTFIEFEKFLKMNELRIVDFKGVRGIIQKNEIADLFK